MRLWSASPKLESGSFSAMSLPALSVQELKAEIDSGKPLFLLDVREPDEVALGAIPGVVAIPMGQVPSRLSEIPQDQDVVVICRSGGRSGRITEVLLGSGYSRVRNLSGGTMSWSALIDPSVEVD